MSYSRYLELHHLDLVQHLGTSIHVICIMLLVQAPGFSFRGSSSPYIYLQTTSVLVAPSSNRNNNGRSSKMFRSGDLFRGGGSRGRPAGSAAAAVTDDSNASEAGIAAGITDDEMDEGDDDEPFPIWSGMSAFEEGQTEAPSAGVIIVDPFCDYLGIKCQKLLEEAGYAVVKVLSQHVLSVVMKGTGAEIFRAPTAGREAEWVAYLPFPPVAVLCESDAGLATAERLQAALLGPRFGGVNEARRDKFLMNEELRQAGLDAVCQIKTGNWSDAREFLRALGKTNSRQQEYPPSSSSSPPSSHSSCSSWAGRLTTPDLKDNGEKKAKQTHQENDEFLKGSGVSVEGASGWVGRGVGSDQQQRKNTDYMQDASAVRAAERGDGDGDRGNDDEDGYCREGGVMSVVKPARGCASGSVFLCRGEREAEEAFRKILGAPKYGTPGAVNEEVVVQEFLEGTEYVVDTVSRDGEHKIMAIWKYDKRPANGAPFVYFATKLRASDGEDEQAVIKYARAALDALGVKYGPTHTEVMMVNSQGGNDSDESLSSNREKTPFLVEVNTRWHLTDFAPLTDACVGYNAVEETLSAYLDPVRFEALPQDPPTGLGSKYGMVVHLVSYVSGKLDGIDHEEEIRNLESFVGIDVYADPARGGTGEVKKTIDIRSDAGWVHLVHENLDKLEQDYRRVVELMPTMYRVSQNEEGGDRYPE